jgi:SNF2 family DNA or RNA helicase
MTKPVKDVSYSDPYHIRSLIHNKKFSNFEKFKLNLRAYEIQKLSVIDKLISMDVLRSEIDAHPYQMKTALSVLKNMNTNAILADEVGLGKTIEAGIIIKELLLRKLINSVLILVPKALENQWKEEMSEKFGEKFVIAGSQSKEFVNFELHDKVICSTGLLRHRINKIKKRHWDLIIVDEAHKFKNINSKGRIFLTEIPRDKMLLLTATPICNKITDIFSIVDIIYPGLLGSLNSFVSTYAADSKCRVIDKENAGNLRKKLFNVMCRTRRIETDVPFSKRFVESRIIEATPEEIYFIDSVTKYLRNLCENKYKTVEELKKQNPALNSSEAQSNAILIFNAITIQQSLSSSPDSLISTLNKRYRKHPTERNDLKNLIKLAKNVKQPAKIKLLKNILSEIKDEQAVIFCLRKATTERLKRELKKFGRGEIYSGNVGTKMRKKILNEFKEGKIKYLIATDAAAEGLNLQHCNILFNYDLHWNPMKIEQRIGRIHRFGQEKDVTIFNLSIKDTLDDYVLHVLFQKIDLFKSTIGSMETIISEFKEDEDDIQKTIIEILIRNKNKLNIKKKLKELSTNINYIRKKQQLAERFTKGVLG